MRKIWSSRVTLNALRISVNTKLYNIQLVVETNALGAYWVRYTYYIHRGTIHHNDCQQLSVSIPNDHIYIPYLLHNIQRG